MDSSTRSYEWYRTAYQDKSTVKAILAADTGTFDNVIAARNALEQLFVQRITFNVTTDAAQTLTFQDDAGTPIVFAKSKASPGLGSLLVADFGPRGFPLTLGKNLDVVISGAGLAGQISIEAYQQLTGVGAPA